MIRFGFLKTVIFLSVSFIGIASVALWYQSSVLKDIKTGEVFEEVLPMRDAENLIDIGIVDFDSNNYLDIFTTNHNQRQLLLRNNGEGSYNDVLSEVGLSQSVMFPKIELANRAPDSNVRGFYIYWENNQLVFRWVPRSGMAAPSGNIKLSSRVKITHNSGFDISIAKNKKDAGSDYTNIKFAAESEGEFRITPDYIAIPVSVDMAEEFSLDDIYVGQDTVNPHSHEFVLNLADRHGMAWADYNGDGKVDVYITRGGLKGHMGRFAEKFTDELYRNTGGGFVNVIDKTGIIKGACPGYQVQWVDYNNDGALDIYISCQRGEENQLFRNNGSGIFSRVAKSQGVNITKNSFYAPFLWIDIDLDGDLDLFINDDGQYRFLINTGSGFKDEGERFQLNDVQKMTVSDYDQDGDLDIFAVSTSGNSMLLQNTGGSFKQLPAAAVGLPDSGLTANWVDYDNDGLIDMHVVPGGIYRQNSNHSFDETGILSHELPGSIYKARANWVDLDNDGDRDLILAIYYKKSIFRQLYDRITGQYTPNWQREYQPWKIRMFINHSEGNGNNWLALNLVGRAGNREAIGAAVTLQTNNHRVVSLVGQSDGSHLSQGHYRLYYGLGSAGAEISVEVKWANGDIQLYKNLPVNSTLTLTQD